MKLRIQGSCFLQVGQCFTRNLQMVQMLWPVAHWVMGGVMYSKHTGHFSSLRINSWVGDDVIVYASPADSSPSVSVKVCTNSSLQLTGDGRVKRRL